MSDLGSGLPDGTGDNKDGPVRRIGEPEIIRRGSPFVPDDLPEQNVSGDYDESRPIEPPPEAEEVERQLAHYTFVREEREREVRLLFRDVPADEVAAAFRAAGASLITLAGERAGPPPPPEVPSEEQEGKPPPKRRRKRAGSQHQGGLSLRYFYTLGEIVYTITITSTSGVMASVAPIFPVATLSERELHERMAVVFQRRGAGEPDTDVTDTESADQHD